MLFMYAKHIPEVMYARPSDISTILYISLCLHNKCSYLPIMLKGSETKKCQCYQHYQH